MDLIEALYSMVSEAWGVPLGNDKCIVERDKVLNMLEDIKAQLPVELSEAKRLVSARDEFIGNAKREAESIRRAAEEKARSMVEEQKVVRIARARSSELMATAENRTAELRRLANDYVDDILRRKHGVWLGLVIHNKHYDAVKYLRCAPDDIEVSKGYRVEAAGANRSAHWSRFLFIHAYPDLAVITSQRADIGRFELGQGLFSPAFAHDYTTFGQYVNILNYFERFVK